MPKRFQWLAVFFYLIIYSGLCWSGDAKERFSSALGFSPTITLNTEEGELEFQLMGEAERSFLFFDVYNIAYYIADFPRVKTVNQELLYLEYERDLSKEKVREVLRQGLEGNLGAEKYNALSSNIEALLSSIRKDVEEGDSLLICKTNSGQLYVFWNGLEIRRLSNPDLSKALWNIWAGEESVVDRSALFRLDRS